MKKTVIILFALLTIMCVTGCSKKELKVADDEIGLAVDISGIADPVYRADIEYMLKGELMGGLATSHTDESVMKEQIVFTLDKHSFPEDSPTKDFTFFVVLSGDKKGIKDLFSSAEKLNHSNECEVFEPQYGTIYYFTVSGNYEDGFVLKEKK